MRYKKSRSAGFFYSISQNDYDFGGVVVGGVGAGVVGGLVGLGFGLTGGLVGGLLGFGLGLGVGVGFGFGFGTGGFGLGGFGLGTGVGFGAVSRFLFFFFFGMVSFRAAVMRTTLLSLTELSVFASANSNTPAKAAAIINTLNFLMIFLFKIH